MRLILAFRAFFATLFGAATAERVRGVLDNRALPAPEKPEEKPPAPKPEAVRKPEPVKKPVRNDALTLLATLQREARFVDLTHESLDAYTDQQVGAAARDVLRDCRAVLQRLFALEAVLPREEGASVELPAGFDAGRFRLTGNIVGEPPFRGRLVHHGWEAAKCELPAWTGGPEAARVVAPAEVEL